jgi:hypothetical protein
MTCERPGKPAKHLNCSARDWVDKLSVQSDGKLGTVYAAAMMRAAAERNARMQETQWQGKLGRAVQQAGSSCKLNRNGLVLVDLHMICVTRFRLDTRCICVLFNGWRVVPRVGSIKMPSLAHRIFI